MRALTDPLPLLGADVEVCAWAASGAMALTGHVDRHPLGPPRGLVSRLAALGDELSAAARAVGGHLEIEPLSLLGERAAIAGLHRRGTTSVGGATRLLEAADEWMAISLARPDDIALVPAWLELDGPPPDPWAAIRAEVRTRPADELVARARLVGLPAAVRWEVTRDQRPPIVSTQLGGSSPGELAGSTVVELASLWAGPLCGSLLQEAGATVIKVESTSRPDGARSGPPAFFDLLNAGKRSVALDLSSAEGVRALRDLVTRADVVIEGSRPRALEQMGIVASEVLADGGPRAWVSITGHGRDEPARGWVGFGDDAAVAGGLVAYGDDGPVFCADAVTDPIAGVAAAAGALSAVGAGGRWVIDVALSAVAASLAGPTMHEARSLEADPPRTRPPTGAGPRLGEHNAELGI